MQAGGMHQDLLDWLASVKDDPYAFALGAFPWGEPGTVLEHATPEPWQIEIWCAIRDGLIDLNEAVQIARASGHGIGKSACISIIIIWAFVTSPDTRGVVTANTETQLKTKTWAELGKWFNLCWFMRDHFTLTATALLSKDPSRERTWRIDQVPWSEKNTEAFAGMHNKGKRLLLVMDEASAIPDVIWEVAEGAMTDADTQIIWLAFGNPTKNTGRFKDCFDGPHSKYWNHLGIDSREVSITNKTQIAKWIDTYGDNSDFVRIRVKGIFPKHGMMEFFSASEIDAAMAREVSTSLYDPLCLGVDVARFGMNNSVIWPRKGRDARTTPREVFNGLNTVQLADKVFETSQRLHADGIIIDGGGVGGGVVDNVRRLHLFCYELQFGGKDIIYNGAAYGVEHEKVANNRAAIYSFFRGWLKTGALPNDPEIKKQMLAIKYTFNKKDEIQLESKEDMMADNNGMSPDDIDALACTFAHQLANHPMAGGEHPRKELVESEYNPFDANRMVA